MRYEIDVTRKRRVCGATLYSPWHSREIKCRLWACDGKEHAWWNRRGEMVSWITDEEGRPTLWGIYRKGEVHAG